jgi:hypothetical protein
MIGIFRGEAVQEEMICEILDGFKMSVTTFQ